MGYMIPRKIHCCWLSGEPKPQLFLDCMASWRKYLPDYEFIEWNTSNFDISCNQFVKEAFEAKLYAFVADYIRLYAVFHHGGIYMDMDVEVLKPLEPFLEHRAFFGFEDQQCISMGIFGAEPSVACIKDLMEIYHRKKFKTRRGRYNATANVLYTADYFIKHGLEMNNKRQTVGETVIYPREYLSPKDSVTHELLITENTYTIHHFSATWVPELKKQNEERRANAGKIEKFLRRIIDGRKERRGGSPEKPCE